MNRPAQGTGAATGKMIGPEEMLAHVERACARLFAAGDRYGGLIPSILERESGAIPPSLPAPIPGQRTSDRAYPGCNLIHDEATLKTADALAAFLGRRDFAEGVSAYLQRFATHCTGTETGLFPWGEHAFWHLEDDRVGNSYLLANPAHKGGAIHDHLRQAPLWLWERLHAYNPRCVERFGEGLDFHWQEGEPREYIRHAAIEEQRRQRRGARACDFPRHSGFYIFDWAFAYTKTRRPDFLGQISAMLDYWWEKRDAHNLLLIESRSPADDARFYRTNAPGQTLSLAASLFESADLLAALEPDLARTMRERAHAYAEGFFAAPHDPSSGVFVILSKQGSGEIVEAMPVWGSVYGLWPVSYVALTCLCVYRFTRDERLLRWAQEAGRHYAEVPFPEEHAVPAMDTGLGIGLLADLYELTGERGWLDAGVHLAGESIARYFGGGINGEKPAIPRGASGIDYYDAQMGPGFLLHGLARLAMLALGGACPLDADYTAR